MPDAYSLLPVTSIDIVTFVYLFNIEVVYLTVLKTKH
jgi:hypothetical protein